jgi:hypothetical protein
MRMLVLSIVLLCSGCVVSPLPPAVPVSSVAVPPAVLSEECREFSTPVVINGRQRKAQGTACLQADGSWKIDQSVATAPSQAYVLMPRVYRPYYPPYYLSDPWFYGPTLFFGGAFIGGGWGYEHHHPGWHGAWRPWPPRHYGRR